MPTIARAAHRQGATVALANIYAAGTHVDAFTHDADVTMQALTKYVGGRSDLLPASITVRDEAHHERWGQAHAQVGMAVSPADCGLASPGVQTLAVRLEAIGRSALAVARRLAERPEIELVLHPAVPPCRGRAIRTTRLHWLDRHLLDRLRDRLHAGPDPRFRRRLAAAQARLQLGRGHGSRGPLPRAAAVGSNVRGSSRAAVGRAGGCGRPHRRPRAGLGLRGRRRLGPSRWRQERLTDGARHRSRPSSPAARVNSMGGHRSGRRGAGRGGRHERTATEQIHHRCRAGRARGRRCLGRHVGGLGQRLPARPRGLALAGRGLPDDGLSSRRCFTLEPALRCAPDRAGPPPPRRSGR